MDISLPKKVKKMTITWKGLFSAIIKVKITIPKTLLIRKGLIVDHKCLECGFEGEVYFIKNKVECPDCKTKNDIWIEGNNPPENHL